LSTAHVSERVRRCADTSYEWIDWDSVEDHRKFRADEKVYPKFAELFKPSAKDGKPKGTIIHASLEVDEALPCVKAPLIELTKITPKEGVAMEGIHAVLDEYVAHIRNLLTNQADGATYGHVVERPEQITLITGWKSFEVQSIFCIFQG
jgi:hypothetical protein